MTLRLHWAVVVTSLVGAAVFSALLPWGDPCSIAVSSGRVCAGIPSASQRQLANAVFVVICFLVGFAAASIADSRRYLAGALSVPLSAMLGGITGHYLYAMKGPWFDSKVQGIYLVTTAFIGCLAILGLVGAFASRWTIGKGWSKA